MSIANLAGYLAAQQETLLERWRAAARADDAQPCRRLRLSDAECDDHLPVLLDGLIRALREQETPNVERQGVEHGRQRRRLGYEVTEVLWELTLFRRMILDGVDEGHAQGVEVSHLEIAEARRRMLNLLDRSVHASVAEYVRLAEKERDRAMRELLEETEQKDRFLAMLSHELRNPLAPILNASRILRDVRAVDPRVNQAREIIDRQARYMARLLDDLLEVNRIARGKIELQREEVVLQSAVRHALESCRPALEAKQLHLDVELPADRLIVVGDPTRLAQIATNILANAVKFTPPSGDVRVAVAEERGEVVLRVRDSGIGIASDMLPRVFDLFAQADTSLDRSGGGLGVGLALSKSLVELQGGRIEAHSEGLGKGAEFVVGFPLHRREQTTAGVPQLYAEKRVAVVEDNDDARQSLTTLLESMGLAVLPARNAGEALRLATEDDPDAFVVDIGLPGMDGYELARVVRQLPGVRKRLLIALTGYGSADEKQRAAEAGFDHHLTKPADVDQLYRLLTAQDRAPR